jgi:hypothetical protein
VDFVDGDARLVTSEGVGRPAKKGDAVAEGDTLVTGKDGELHVRMTDDGYIALRPDTTVKVAAYRHQGDKRDKSSFSLLKGSFRSITGWIGKYNRRNYQVSTPSATIGIRGTDHEPMFIPEPGRGERPIGEPGTYDKVNSGRTFIRNPRGTTFISPRQAGFVPARGLAAPRLLPAVPAFFRPARHERVIDEKRVSLRRSLEEHTREIRQRQQEKRLEREKGRGERRSQSKEPKAPGKAPKKQSQEGKGRGADKGMQKQWLWPGEGVSPPGQGEGPKRGPGQSGKRQPPGQGQGKHRQE